MTGDPQNRPLPEPGQHAQPTDFFSDATIAGPALPPDMSTMGAYVPPMTPQQPDPYGYGPPPSSMHPQDRMQSGYLVRPQTAEALPPGSLPTKLAYLWRKDPAYKVLFMAIAAILLCSIVGATMLFTAFSHSAGPQQGNIGAPGPGEPTPTPGGNGALPQPTPIPSPTAVPTPTPLPMPTVVPTPTVIPSPTATDNNGPLIVQITNLPTTVDNHTTVPVTVNANQPGTSVSLTVFYFGAQPVTFQAGPQSVDANGNTTFDWNIEESGFGSFFKRHVTARVVANAQDQNGNTANSNVVTVQVNMQ